MMESKFLRMNRDVLSSMRSVKISIFASILAVFTVLSASSVSASQVWWQSVGRSSAAAQCPETSVSDRNHGWTSWGASWEQWANSGSGGFTCTRSNVWDSGIADSNAGAPGPRAGCTLFTPAMGYVIVVDAHYVLANSLLYTDSSCNEVKPPNFAAFMLYTADANFALAECRRLHDPSWFALPAASPSTLWWSCDSGP